jgi:zinc protease
MSLLRNIFVITFFIISFGCSNVKNIKSEKSSVRAEKGGVGIMKYELDNGLTVILKENHQANVVAFHMWVKVGSADETDDISGISHVYEHMLFKGTKKRGVGEIAGTVEASGGDINAFTSLDQTVYHITMASEFFDTGLDIMADAIQFSSFDAGELEKEQEVIVEEIKRGLDMPGRKLNMKFFETTYGVHTYRRPVIGTEETVRALTREKIIEYFQKWYRPNNMTFVIVGDFDKDSAIKKVNELFKDFPNGESIKVARPAEPEQKEFRFAVIKEDVSETHMNFGYHIPSVRHEDNAALDVLALLLGQGESSRLYASIKSKKSLVHSIYSYAFTPKDPGILMIGVMLEEKNINDMIKETTKELERLKYELVSQEELDKAKLNLESDFIYEKETVQGQARKLGYFATSLGDYLYEYKYLKNIRSVTLEDVRRVANEYINTTNLTIAALLPESSELELDKDGILGTIKEGIESAGKEYPLTAAPAQDSLPKTESPVAVSASNDVEDSAKTVINKVTLDNGITLLVKENHANPTFAIRTIFLGGVRYEDESNNGINNFIAGMLTKGTAKRTAEEIADEVESMASSLDGYSGKNSMGVSGTFLSRYTKEALEITADLTLAPIFKEEEIEKRKKHVLAAIKRQEDELTSLVFNLFKATLYEKSPYKFNMLGTEDTVKSFSRDTLKEYYKKVVAPENLVISIAGDVDTSEITKLVKKYFGDMQKGEFKAPFVPQEEEHTKIKTAVIEKDKEQTHIVLGFPGVSVRDDDKESLEVLSTVLSRQGGRLFIELRDKQSLAYSLTSFSQEGYDPGSFIVYMATSTEKKDKAIKGILTELEKIVNEEVPEDELNMARNYLIGSHEIGLQRNSAQAAQIGFDEIYGLGYGHYKDYAKRILAVTADDIIRVARKYIRLDRYTLAVVGKTEESLD